MPFKTSRGSRHGRPRRSRRTRGFGKSGARMAHCASVRSMPSSTTVDTHSVSPCHFGICEIGSSDFISRGLDAARRSEQRSRRHRPSRRQSVLLLPGGGRCQHRQVSLAFPGCASRCLGLRHPVGSAASSTCSGAARRSPRFIVVTRPGCCSRSTASPASRSSTSSSVRCRRATCLTDSRRTDQHQLSKPSGRTELIADQRVAR